MSRLTEHTRRSAFPVCHVSRDVLSVSCACVERPPTTQTDTDTAARVCVRVMGRRRRRSRDDDDSDVDMTSYSDVTRSSALLAYIQVSAADRRLGISVVGYLGYTGGLYVSDIHSNSAVQRDARLQPGDKLNSINGFRLNHLGNDDAFRLLTTTVSRQLGREHTVRLGIIRSRDVTVLRHWQQWSRDDQRLGPNTTTTTTTTTTTSGRPTAVVQGCSSVYFTTTRF